MPRLKNVFVLCENSKVIGAWSTLKMLCEDKQKEVVSFPSYWTLARKTGNGLIEFTEGGVLFEIYILPVHGYSRISKDTEGK
jgi:hypothetical protein